MRAPRAPRACSPFHLLALLGVLLSVGPARTDRHAGSVEVGKEGAGRGREWEPGGGKGEGGRRERREREGRREGEVRKGSPSLTVQLRDPRRGRDEASRARMHQARMHRAQMHRARMHRARIHRAWEATGAGTEQRLPEA